MAVLGLLYRSRKISSYEDNYGGNVFDNYYYSYLLLKSDLIYIFSSSPMFSSPKWKPIVSFDDRKTLKNLDVVLKNATHSPCKRSNDGKIEFGLPIQSTNDHGQIVELHRVYNAVIENNGKSLRLKAWNDNTPDMLIIDGEFDLIDYPSK